MPSAADVRTTIANNFATYVAELEQTADVWDKKPDGSADGEAAWCAREVAEHIAGSGPFFGAGIASAVGIEGPTPSRFSFPTHAEGVAETRRTHGLLMDVLNQLNDQHLDIEVDHPRFGKLTVGRMTSIVEGHLLDHANQLKTLRGG